MTPFYHLATPSQTFFSLPLTLQLLITGVLWLEPQTSTLFRLFFQVSLSALWLPMPSLSTLKPMPRQSLCPDLYPVGHSDVFTGVSRNHPQSHRTELPSHFLRVTSISHHYDKVSARSNDRKTLLGGSQVQDIRSVSMGESMSKWFSLWCQEIAAVASHFSANQEAESSRWHQKHT